MDRDAPAQGPVAAATAVYSDAMLRVYDGLVLDVVSPAVWRCPKSAMAAQYDRYVSGRHLDIGPGTGYFLDRCQFPCEEPQLALLDLNPTVLETARKRVERHRPTVHHHNVLEPYDLGGLRFTSASLNFVLHCLPGTLPEKSVLFDHLLEHLDPGARVFGSTVLAHGVRHTLASRVQLELLNRQGVFHNRGDSLEGLEAELGGRFREFEVRVRGAVGLFVGRV